MQANRVVIAIPPSQVVKMTFAPALSSSKALLMENFHPRSTLFVLALGCPFDESGCNVRHERVQVRADVPRGFLAPGEAERTRDVRGSRNRRDRGATSFPAFLRRMLLQRIARTHRIR